MWLRGDGRSVSIETDHALVLSSWHRYARARLLRRLLTECGGDVGDLPARRIVLRDDGVVERAELNAYLTENLSYWARRYHGRDQVALIQNWSKP